MLRVKLLLARVELRRCGFAGLACRLGGLATHLIDGRQVMLQLVQHTHQLLDLLGLLLGARGLIVELGGRLRNRFNLLIKIRRLLGLLHQIKVLLLLHIHPGWVGLGGKILGEGRLDLS